MQRWQRIHDYARSYQEFVYKYYASHSHQTYLCTYYNLDLHNSVFDGDILDGGSYEKVGSKSGLRWRKIMFLPVYNLEAIQPQTNADEKGVTKAGQTTTFNFPTVYDIQPMPHDFIKFDQHVLKPTDNTYPMYEVENIDKATNTDITFWKVALKNSYRKEDSFVEKHISSVHVFFDYTKKIYDSNTGTFLYRLLEKNTKLKAMENHYQKRSNFYFGK